MGETRWYITRVKVVPQLLRSKKFIVPAIIFLISVGASVAVYSWMRNFFANQTVIVPSWVERVSANPTTVAPVVKNNDGVTLPKPWNGKERVNVLLMGIDQREGEKDVGYRTDTMIILTIDPVTHEAGMLSVPRDTWVEIPDFDHFDRINTANYIGDTQDYPGGGSALARKAVERLLGIPIHYTARLNFTAFETLVDAIGGVEIDVENDIYDPEYPTNNYGTEVFQLSKGLQTLDGETALKYARTRHNLPNGDFDRARHQQQVIMAIREKVKRPDVLASLITRGPELIENLSASIKTDMTFEQAQELAALALQIDRNKIRFAVLDSSYTTLTITPSGAAVQVPMRDRIAKLRNEFFSASVNSALGNTTQ